MYVGGTALDVSCTVYNAENAFVDSGTTYVYLPQQAMQAFVQAMVAATGLPQGVFTQQQCVLQPFSATPQVCTASGSCYATGKIAWPDVAFSYRSANNSQQLVYTPWAPLLYLSTALFSTSSSCLTVGVKQSATGQMIIGAVYQRQYYVVYDQTTLQVGFAATAACQNLPSGSQRTPSLIGSGGSGAGSCLA